MSQARKRSLPVNATELVATWKSATEEPFQGSRSKVLLEYGDSGC